MLEGWTVLDTQGNRTTVHLTGQRLNVVVSDKAFTWDDRVQEAADTTFSQRKGGQEGFGVLGIDRILGKSGMGGRPTGGLRGRTSRTCTRMPQPLPQAFSG